MWTWTVEPPISWPSSCLDGPPCPPALSIAPISPNQPQISSPFLFLRVPSHTRGSSPPFPVSLFSSPIINLCPSDPCCPPFPLPFVLFPPPSALDTMIRFEDMSPEIMEAMCTPMHRILPVNPSASQTIPSSSNPRPLGSLFLGSMAATLDRDLLATNKITHLVQVLDAPWLPVSERDGFRCLRISILDAPTADLRPHLEGACEFINSALQAGSNVLVHCQQGVSRSPSIVIAYLIHNLGMSYDQAFSLVKKQRVCIRPNPGFVDVLRAWEGKWRAQVAVSASSPSAAAPQIRRFNTSYTGSRHSLNAQPSGSNTPAAPPSTPSTGLLRGGAAPGSASPSPVTSSTSNSNTGPGPGFAVTVGPASGLSAPSLARGISYAGPGSTPTFTLKQPPAFNMKHRASAAAPPAVTPVQAT